jgi:hypothetical protein
MAIDASPEIKIPAGAKDNIGEPIDGALQTWSRTVHTSGLRTLSVFRSSALALREHPRLLTRAL